MAVTSSRLQRVTMAARAVAAVLAAAAAVPLVLVTAVLAMEEPLAVLAEMAVLVLAMAACSPDRAAKEKEAPSPIAARSPEAEKAMITDDEYFGKVQVPTVDGITMNMDYVKKTYGEFIRKHHISPETVAEYMKMEGGTFKKVYDETMAKKAAETKAIKENFEAQGAALKKAYSQEQIDTAVGALATFSEDKDFMQVATTNLSNNPTLVKLLLNWAEHHKVDDNTGAGQGQGSGGLSGFAERWTGKKM